MPTMRRNPAGGVIDTTGMGRGAGVVRPPMGMPAFQDGGVIGPTTIGSPAFRRGGKVRGYQEGGEVDDDQQDDLAGTQYAGANDIWSSGGKRMNGRFLDDLGPVTPGPEAAKTLADARAPSLANQAGLNDVEQGPRAFTNVGGSGGSPPMPQDPRMLAYKNQQSGQLAQQAWDRQPQQPVQTAQPEVIPTMRAGSTEGRTGAIADRFYNAVSPALRRLREPGYQEGGYVDDEGLEDQGADDAMMDPMAMVSSALSYGKKKYGIEPADQQGEMGFDDGGVVPTQDEQAQGNPNAIDPRQAMAYLAGDGAVSPEIAQALEQRVDPQGQLNPTQRAMAAIGVAPDDEARFGLIQHYRTKYNGFAGAAKAALSRGDMGEAAHQASLAMDSVPNGKRTQFAPAQGGLAMIERPAFGGGGGGAPPQPQAQAFDDGGEVEEEDLNPAVPVQQPLENPPSEIMPTQSVLPAQSVAQLLDTGFDNHIAPKPAIAAPAFQPQGPGSAYAQDQADAQRSAQLGGWGSAEEYAATQQRPNMFDPLAQKIQGSLLPTPATPAPTTGSEAATRPPEPVAPAAAPATAPVTRRPTASAEPPEGAVIDENRVNPFTGKVRAAAPGTFGSREAARRAGTEVPMTAEAARGGGSEDFSAARRAPRGVVPTADEEPLGDATMRKVVKGNLGDSTGVVNVQTRPGSTPRDFLHRRGAPTTDPEELRIEAAQRQAAALHPWVGRDEAARGASAENILKRDDEHKKALDVAQVRATTAEQIAANRIAGNADLEDRRAAHRSDLQTQKDIAALTRKQSGQEAALNLAAAKSKLAAASSGDRERLRLLGGMMRNDPSLQSNPGKLLNLAGPIMQSTSLRPEELLHAANAAFAGGGAAAPAAAPPASGTGTSYLEDMTPGDGAPRNYGGKPVHFYLSPDGREMVREDLYEARFGKKPNVR